MYPFRSKRIFSLKNSPAGAIRFSTTYQQTQTNYLTLGPQTPAMDLESLLSDDSEKSESADSSAASVDGKPISRKNILERMRNIDPYEFEFFIADLWEAQGWEAEVSQASKDMGVDVIATKSDGMVDQKVVIQTKRYSAENKVGQPKIQQYHALKEQDSSADAAVVVTTSTFTSNAREWADSHNVKLVDGNNLVDIIKNQYEYILEDYAPTLDEIEAEGSTQKSDVSVGVPKILQENHEEIAAVLGLVGVFLLLSGELNQAAIFGGMIVFGLAAGLYMAPEKLWEFAMGEEDVIQTFPSGAAVVEQRSEIKYISDDGETKKFNSTDDKQSNQQRAVVYAKLKEQHGDIQEIEGGAVPTNIVSAGQEQVIAYRFAVQKESPAAIASDMDITQKEVTDHLSNSTG